MRVTSDMMTGCDTGDNGSGTCHQDRGVSHNKVVITLASHGTNTSSLAGRARFVWGLFKNIPDPNADIVTAILVCGSIENSVDVPSKCGPTSQNTIYFVFIMFYVLLCTITVSQYQNKTRK